MRITALNRANLKCTICAKSIMVIFGHGWIYYQVLSLLRIMQNVSKWWLIKYESWVWLKKYHWINDHSKNLKIREFRVFYLFIKMSKLDKNESFIWFIAGQKWSFREKKSLGNRIWWLRTVIKYSNFKNYWWRHKLWLIIKSPHFYKIFILIF